MTSTMKLVKLSLFLSLLCNRATARSWKEIETIHDLSPSNKVDQRERIESDPYYLELSSPTENSIPNSSPTQPTTNCEHCGDYTALSPTSNDEYPTNQAPSNPPRGYFNYDIGHQAKYGPGYPNYIQDGDNNFKIRYKNNQWGNVQKSNNYYWDEFGWNGWGTWNGILSKHNMDQSVCASGNRQSPIDIRKSGVACVETHQIRVRPGDFRIQGDKIKKRIEPNKLRFVFPRRPCRNLENVACQEPDPPFADFPNGWRGDSDAMHVDIKVPAEHQIYGEKFDAEMQIFHLHPDRRLLPAISILIKVTPNGYNSVFQEAIDVFQHEFDADQAECGRRLREGRKMVSDFHSKVISQDEKGNDSSKSERDYYENWGDFSTDLDDPSFVKEGEETQRRLTEKWHPYHPDLMKTVYFYGYDGSLTEPPCTEIVSWFIMDEPMTISQGQLDQMKNILFNHVDGNCQRTSVHFHKRGVARPIQDTNGRMVWHCTRNHFLPDAEKNKWWS